MLGLGLAGLVVGADQVMVPMGITGEPGTGGEAPPLHANPQGPARPMGALSSGLPGVSVPSISMFNCTTKAVDNLRAFRPGG
mmetsp:Transcript_35493/g.82935  ORF Transcript_35493/g.82935 Transcript_35493/m.82935 type:complete len:82 (-) Transcript_35493:55-300(-)